MVGMKQYVGYRIDPHTGEGVPVAAGDNRNEVFSKAFARIACEISAFGGPSMAVAEKPITPDEAAHLERICAEHLDGTPS